MNIHLRPLGFVERCPGKGRKIEKKKLEGGNLNEGKQQKITVM